jgi:FkbM family methyltransferase
MKNQRSSIIKLPSFIFQVYEIDNLNFFQKLYVMFIGKLSQLIIKQLNENFFCIGLNLLFQTKSKIYFDKQENLYAKNINNELKIFYPNKRILRVIQREPHIIFEKLFDTYCLDKISFQNGDTIIDCGANVGELNYSFFFKNLNIKYFGIEPEIETFHCLQKNKIRSTDNFYNLALSNKNGDSKFYLDSVGGNSSLEYFGKDDHIVVKTNTLDSLDLSNNIKLLKIEAEGHEPEILEAAKKTLRVTDYVSVDFGYERGVNQNSTVNKVNNILNEMSFELIELSEFRLVGLYKNKKL